MILDTIQSMSLLIISVLAVLILLRILFIVHRQSGRFKELEQRLKMMEHTESVETDKAKEEN